MEQQFPFTPTGVAQWQEALYTEGPTAVQAERGLISSHFIGWLSERFVLSAEQRTYADDLGQLTHQTYAVAISNALAEQTPILLEKTDPITLKDNPYENPKITELKNRIQSRQTAAKVGDQDTVYERSLIFSIYYLPE